MFGGSQSALVGIRKGLPGRQEKRSGGSNLWLSVSSPSHCSRTSCNVYRSSQWWKTWAKSATPFLRLTFLASASSAEITTKASARIVANSVTLSERMAIDTFPVTVRFSLSSRPICTCGALNSRVSLEAQTAQAGRDTAELSISTSKELSRTLVCKSQNVVRVAADARVGLGVLPVPSPDGGVRVFLGRLGNWCAALPSSMTTSECSSLIR